MTKGAVLFAHNNEEINYVELAVFSAKRINYYLNLPVSLISDEASLEGNNLEVFDQVICTDDPSNFKKSFYNGIEDAKRLSWKNGTRYNAYDLTPYDETLVLDVDYIVSSDTLKNCWDQDDDFLIYNKSYDLTGWREGKEFQYLSEMSVPFYWATAFRFKKTPQVELFFNLLEHIKSNWQYYKVLYQLHGHNFRNDYAFSIAIHMMNGFSENVFAGAMPGKMFYILDIDFLEKISDDKMLFLVQKTNSSKDYIPLSTKGLDVHVMNKYSLLKAIKNV